MSQYYEGLPWFDTNYKIRRPLTLTPFDFLPGTESLCAVKLDRQSLLFKIKPDYSDLLVVYSSSGVNVGTIPFYTLEEDPDTLSIIFESQFPVEDISSSNYTLYYSAKTESRQAGASDILDSDLLSLSDEGNTDLTHWAFTKPTIDWVQKRSQNIGAKANFEFYGHKVDFYFEIGPQKGIVEFTINEETPAQSVDCFSTVESEAKLVSIDTNSVGLNKVRFVVTGQKNPASSSSSIGIVRAEYNQVLLGVAEEEQFYSAISNTFTIGS